MAETTFDYMYEQLANASAGKKKNKAIVATNEKMYRVLGACTKDWNKDPEEIHKNMKLFWQSLDVNGLARYETILIICGNSWVQTMYNRVLTAFQRPERAMDDFLGIAQDRIESLKCIEFNLGTMQQMAVKHGDFLNFLRPLLPQMKMMVCDMIILLKLKDFKHSLHIFAFFKSLEALAAAPTVATTIQTNVCANVECPHEVGSTARCRLCPGCKLARYCSKACKNAALKMHEPQCKRWDFVAEFSKMQVHMSKDMEPDVSELEEKLARVVGLI